MPRRELPVKLDLGAELRGDILHGPVLLLHHADQQLEVVALRLVDPRGVLHGHTVRHAPDLVEHPGRHPVVHPDVACVKKTPL